MNKMPWLISLTTATLVAAGAACGASESPAPELPAPAVHEEDPPPVAETGATEEQPEVDPEAEERAARLQAARAQLAEQSAIENERWTDELREAARELAETEFETFAEGVTAALSSDHRMPGHADRDPQRRPLETLTFFGLEPGMTVLEFGPGGGWYTEILAPVLSPSGRLLVPEPEIDEESVNSFAAYYAERFDAFLARSPELFGAIEKVPYDLDAPDLGLSEELDAVIMIRGMHGRFRDGTLEPWLATFYEALRPGGVFGVVQHRAEPDADPDESAPLGYLPEAYVIERVTAAGFELADSSEINANPADPKHPEYGVWLLPPTLRLGDEDREKYEAIGESDRMTLRFVKPAAD
jgi:predicted methyltransferase